MVDTRHHHFIHYLSLSPLNLPLCFLLSLSTLFLIPFHFQQFELTMAGMLPGVECARRRRFHQASDSPGGAHGGSRRSAFCLYTSNYEPIHANLSSSSWRSMKNQADQDHRLGGAAREAKERLDERLRTHTKCDFRRDTANNQSKERSKQRGGDGNLGEIDVQNNNQGSSVWGKLMKWRSSEKEDCAVCLERFKAGQTLLHLPCAHRFHDTCLIPWLETNAHCPYCRMAVLS